MFAQSLLYLIVLKNLLIYTQALISSGNETWLDHTDEPHAFASNMWWRLANFTAKSTGKKSDCYVCTKMPQSASGPHVSVKSPKTDEELFCPLFLSTVGEIAPQISTVNWTCPDGRKLTVAGSKYMLKWQL